MRRTLAILVLVLGIGGRALPAAALDIQEVVSPGGVKAWLVEDHSNPILSLSFSFAGGESSDPAGKEGRARLVSGLLDEGAGEMDSQAFQKALTDNSISLRFNSRIDRFSGELVTLTETRELAVDMLRLALTAPRFDAEPVERIRAQIQASLRNDLQNPRSIASRAWWAASFPDHPYGRSGDGTADSVAAVTVDDLRAFVAAAFARKGLVVAAVGDIDAPALSALLDRVFGSLPAAGSLAPVPDTAPKAVGQTMVVEVPVPQSLVVFGHAGIARDDPDWYAASLLNEIMAGGFGSRLTEEIREKRGLVYGVYAYLLPLDHAPLVMGGLATQNARVAESVEILRQEWKRMADQGPTDAERSDALTYLLGSFPLRLTDSDGTAGVLMGLQEGDLPIDYLDRREALYRAVTPADLRRVAARLYRPEQLTVVFVGMPEAVTPTAPAPRVPGVPSRGG
ncbi:pitrilysin family protein [Thalassobaculum sp.]|uniref:M16 family metallopeptidase n=1 Tax=Thalassobaculum sp. TaxID=2022740 RepID=UPI0032EEB258